MKAATGTPTSEKACVHYEAVMRLQQLRHLKHFWIALTVATAFGLVGTALGHGVDGKDAGFLQINQGLAILPFVYLGAKHMVTGYDHLLFLFGVIFFLYRSKDIATYVTLFTIGHSLTLLFGVLGNIRANAYLVDTIIGFSVVYKAFDNMGGFKRFFGIQPNTRVAVLIFGLFHGFGLATKLQDFQLSNDGLVGNMVSFNVGVEIGQVLALACAVWLLNLWRSKPSFLRYAFAANTLLMAGGFALMGYQLIGYTR
jgi:hypothetical protein